MAGGAGGGGGAADAAGGGYSGAGSQNNPNPGINGLGGGTEGVYGGCAGPGGGYFIHGKGIPYDETGIGEIGGQAGSSYGSKAFISLKGGSGGMAGAGGNVTYMDASKIFAYNGDMITNDDYLSSYYEYNKDGTTKSDRLIVLSKQNGERIIPTKIFAQSGIIRATYTTNQTQFDLDKVVRSLLPGEVLPAVATEYTETKCVKATNETSTPTTGYTNGYMPNQGIGSGAGYLEASNGTFLPN